jgi:NIMA (never in mitosis gene a)-related kinase
MLQTIRIPKNLNFLTEKLPKANYSPVKVMHLDRKGFFKTIGGLIEE